MGEIAEMMLEEILDEQTGEYLGKAVGYPRTKQMQKKSGCYGGIRHWLSIRGKDKHKTNKIIMRYGKEVLHKSFVFDGDKASGQYHLAFNKHIHILAQIIQTDFKSFTDWYNLNY